MIVHSVSQQSSPTTRWADQKLVGAYCRRRGFEFSAELSIVRFCPLRKTGHRCPLLCLPSVLCRISLSFFIMSPFSRRQLSFVMSPHPRRSLSSLSQATAVLCYVSPSKATAFLYVSLSKATTVLCYVSLSSFVMPPLPRRPLSFVVSISSFVMSPFPRRSLVCGALVLGIMPARTVSYMLRTRSSFQLEIALAGWNIVHNKCCGMHWGKYFRDSGKFLLFFSPC